MSNYYPFLPAAIWGTVCRPLQNPCNVTLGLIKCAGDEGDRQGDVEGGNSELLARFCSGTPPRGTALALLRVWLMQGTK